MEWPAFDLAPLQHSRPLRAWERRPLAPFSRSKTGAKKIWKRALAAAPSTRLSGTPTKTTKRRCVSAFHGIETQSERLDSPHKRITTRSSLDKTLIALAEDEDSEQLAIGQSCYDDEPEDVVEGTIVETLDENGHLVEVHDNADWYDEEDVFDDTLLHLDAAISHEGPSDQMHADEASDPAGIKTDQSVDAQLQREMMVDSLPDGFVSPVRRRRTVSKRLQESSRRRSAPFAFAPQITLMAASAMSKSEEQHEEQTEQQPEKQAVVQDCELSNDPIHCTHGKQLGGNVDMTIEQPPTPPVLLTPEKERKRSTSSSPTRQSPRRKRSTPEVKHSTAQDVKESPASPSPRKPRLSDDTAFLQAFLDRAAGNVATKEALEHRQESAKVKQAMTSPEKSVVLAEMSPNVAKFTAVKDAEFTGFDDEEQDKVAANVKQPLLQPKIKTAERSINAAIHTKIMLRSGQAVPPTANAAQGRINLTRSNTRANKGESLGPSARLQQLKADDTPIRERPCKVNWNDKLDINYIDVVPDPDTVATKPKSKTRRTLVTPKSAGDSVSKQRRLPAPGTPARLPLDLQQEEPKGGTAEDKLISKKQTPAKPRSRIPSRLPKSRAAAVARERDEPLSTLASPAKRRVSVYDRKLLGSNDIESDEAVTLPLLASPAKKVRRAVIFGTGQLDGHPQKTREPALATLASPAKKRSR